MVSFNIPLSAFEKMYPDGFDVYLDGSGYTGIHLLDHDQPV